jgi:hypothetical protein
MHNLGQLSVAFINVSSPKSLRSRHGEIRDQSGGTGSQPNATRRITLHAQRQQMSNVSKYISASCICVEWCHTSANCLTEMDWSWIEDRLKKKQRSPCTNNNCLHPHPPLYMDDNGTANTCCSDVLKAKSCMHAVVAVR